MDLFQHPYYRLNKLMMSFIGQWPDQNSRTRRVCCTVFIYFYVTELMSRILTILNNREDSKIIMDVMAPLVGEVLLVIYFLDILWNSQTTLQLLNRIRTDWQVWAHERQVKILHEYTDLGKKLNIAFAAAIYSGGFLVITQPVIEKIIDIVLKNGTEPGRFVVLVDYYHVDEQKYYFYVILYYNVTLIVTSIPALTNTFMLISYTQHSSGIFAALGHKLECIRNKDTSVETAEALHALNDRHMVQLTWCVDRHNDAIEYVNLLEANYTWNFFITTGIGMIVINAVGLQVLRNPNDLQVALTSGSIISFMGLYFLIQCYASQMLIDHSARIRDCIYNSQWYRLSVESQKLLQCMTMRCNVPSQLTAGNMMIMSIRTVWLMFKTVVSYFAFVRSTQGL